MRGLVRREGGVRLGGRGCVERGGRGRSSVLFVAALRLEVGSPEGALAAASRRGSGPVAGAAVRQFPPRCSPSCALSPAAFHRPRSWAVRGGRGGSCWRRQCRSVTHAGGRSTRAARRSIRRDAAPVARSVCPRRAQPDPWRALAPGAFRARECRYSHPERQWPQRRVRRCTQRNTGVTGGARAR